MFSKRQKEIIDKSIEIIGKKGIQGLTIKNLAKEIGVTEPAIYRYFESKNDILLAILKDLEEASLELNKKIKTLNTDTIGKVQFMFSKIIEIFSKTPSQISVVFSEELFKNEKILKDKIVEIMNLKEKAIEDIIAEGQQKGEIRNEIDNKTLALIVVGSLRFIVKKWDLQNQKTNLIEEGEKLINGLKIMLKA